MRYDIRPFNGARKIKEFSAELNQLKKEEIQAFEQIQDGSTYTIFQVRSDGTEHPVAWMVPGNEAQIICRQLGTKVMGFPTNGTSGDGCTYVTITHEARKDA